VSVVTASHCVQQRMEATEQCSRTLGLELCAVLAVVFVVPTPVVTFVFVGSVAVECNKNVMCERVFGVVIACAKTINIIDGLQDHDLVHWGLECSTRHEAHA
jgi:hypothetical protein